MAAVLEGQSINEALAGRRAAQIAPAVRELAFGALRRHAWGSFLLGRLMQRPPKQVVVSALLLCALHRLETRPEASHTTVNQAVLAAGHLAHGAFSGLINGVLRNYLRQRATLLALIQTDAAATHWHPAWWLTALQQAHPEHWQQIVAAGNQQPPMTLRVNQRRTTCAAAHAALTEAGLAATQLAGGGLQLAQPVAVTAIPGFSEGRLSVQDAGAQRAAILLAPLSGQRVLDACAAPGGKTGHLLEQADCSLLALESDAARLPRISENLQRLGLSATVRHADCRHPRQWWDKRAFDRILADVPCSASGVVRRHPDAKWLRRPSDIARFAATQAQILHALWPTLAADGRLLYATCSVFPEENQQQIAGFLQRTPGARLLAEEAWLPNEEHDGFYYALLAHTA